VPRKPVPRKKAVFFGLLLGALRAASAFGQEAGDGGDIRAQLVPKRFTTLSSEIAARIDRISVKEGERFKDGQILVSLDCALQRATLDEARAALGAAEKSRSVTKRMVELNSGGVLEADLAAAEAAKAQAKLQSAQVVLSKCSVAAPYQGRLVEQKVREHQYVQAGQAMLDILDDSALEVEFIAPSRWLSKLKPGMAFRVQVDETGRDYPAKVIRIGAKVDPVSHSVKVAGEIAGGFAELVAGMSGQVVFAPPSP